MTPIYLYSTCINQIYLLDIRNTFLHLKYELNLKYFSILNIIQVEVKIVVICYYALL